MLVAAIVQAGSAVAGTRTMCVSVAPTAVPNDRRGGERRILGDRAGAGLARPGAAIARRRRRQRPVRRRLDLETAIAWTLAVAGKITRSVCCRAARVSGGAVIGNDNSVGPVNHGRPHAQRPIETEVALH